MLVEHVFSTGVDALTGKRRAGSAHLAGRRARCSCRTTRGSVRWAHGWGRRPDGRQEGLKDVEADVPAGCRSGGARGVVIGHEVDEGQHAPTVRPRRQVDSKLLGLPGEPEAQGWVEVENLAVTGASTSVLSAGKTKRSRPPARSSPSIRHGNQRASPAGWVTASHTASTGWSRCRSYRSASRPSTLS